MPTSRSADPPTAEDAATRFKALADPRRVRVLRVLLEVPDTLCGCELSDILDLADYQVSRALSTLRRAGLVHDRARTGTWVHYEAARGRDPDVDHLLDLVASIPLTEVETERLSLRYGLRERAGCVLGAQHPTVVATFEAEGLGLPVVASSEVDA